LTRGVFHYLFAWHVVKKFDLLKCSIVKSRNGN
jgi:hypothetical protein